MPGFKFKHMQSRLTAFLLLPVAVLLIAAGLVGFVFATDSLLEEWRKAATLELQQEAHQVDMQLARPKQWVEMFHSVPTADTGGHHVRDWVLQQLEQVEGVVQIRFQVPGSPAARQPRSNTMPMMQGRAHFMHTEGMPRGMQFHHGRITEITPPQYDAERQSPTVSLISNLLDSNEQVVGKLEVEIRFEELFAQIGETGVWQNHQAYIVDDAGRILFSTVREQKERFAANAEPLELQTLKAIHTSPHGTIMGAGYPPERVAGFYHLMEAPWTLVLIAPGRIILAPILQFSWYYLLFGMIFIVFVLILIRWGTGQSVASIKTISRAAEHVAGGNYDQRLPVRTADEVGELTRNFNAMVSQLQERRQLKRAMGLAMEVQQNLLPQQALNINGVDIYGKSVYCDETGGDYYDFINFQEMGQDRIGVAVGDVVGHGVAAALMMTSVRAFLRAALRENADLSRVASHVNQLLCLDTTGTGNFMTLFFLLFDTECRELHWVRAGHDPAIVYDRETGDFRNLDGEGIALGVDPNWQFREYRSGDFPSSTVVLIGTDGIWETENEAGEKFGKARLRKILEHNSEGTSEEIVAAVLAAIEAFRGDVRQLDDVTLVVARNIACGLNRPHASQESSGRPPNQ